MKWAILLYATLIFPTGEKQQVISWNIPFSSYEQCEQFYKKEKDTLHKGVLDHGKEVYHPEIQLVEMGCARGEIRARGDKPIVTGQRRLYFTGDPV
tara:strand:- start:252 stop:539 length:288 start_codon:yes stop_codon:yes gene_type:complete